jgi:hypothetical protein
MKNKMAWMLFLLLLIGASGASFAQSTNAGDIRGVVTDNSGALIPGVKVTVLNLDTGVSKDFFGNQDGLYDTSSIVAGTYQLTFSKQGFETLVRGPINLQVGFFTVNAQMQVGAITEQVTVTADVSQLQTESGEHNTTFESKSMSQLPQVAGTAGPDWENFMILLPGASGAAVSTANPSSNPGQVVAINGNLPYSNVLADGASTTLSHSQNANPAIFETVAELQVNTSTFSAQYGIGGAIFNQISKGGTDRFHGSAYDYLQNDALTAYDYAFGKSKTDLGPIPFLRYNNFGGSVGGPILKKKMFFYFDYDQIVDHGNSSGTNDIPTTALMAGDFTSIRPTLFDPTTQTIAYDAGNHPYPVRKSFAQEYGSNTIPTNLFDTLAVKMQALYPTPSNHISGGHFVTGQIGSEGETQKNFYTSVLQPAPYRKYFGRLDYDITPNNRLTMSDTQSDTPQFYPSQVTVCPIGCQSGDVDNNNAQITDVWNISSRTINEARIGYTWQGNFFVDQALNKGLAAKLGWSYAKVDDFPGITYNNNYPFAWITPSSNAVYKEHVFDPSDVVTLIRGKHILHFGGEVLIYRDNSTAWGNANPGTFTFSGQYTQQWALDSKGNAAPVAGTGFEYADFLLGYANQWNAGVTPEYGARLKSPQVFVQDDYKISPNLTVNLGVRWQINHGWTERHGNETSFDTNIVNPATNKPGAAWFGSTHANGRTALDANVWDTVMPRVGFSWLVNPKTTLRGGFGQYAYNWSLDTYGYGMGNAFGASGNLTDSTNGVTPVTQLGGAGNVFGTSTPLTYTSASTDPTRFNGGQIYYTQYHSPVPKIYQWNLSTQRQLGTDYVAGLSYVASHGYHLNFYTDLNEVPASQLSPNDTQYQPYQAYQHVVGTTNNTVSNYHSLQAEITKRMTHGFSMSFNYVWSHMLDSLDSSGWGGRGGDQVYQNGLDPGANYSNSSFDIRNSFKGYAVYELPFGKGKPFLNNNRLLDEAIGGWQLSGTLILSTGNPFSIWSNQPTYNQDGTNNVRAFPNWSGQSIRPTGGRTISNWYNAGAFTQPDNGTYGNVRRNSIYGPGINEVNLSGSKTFALPWEGMGLQIRCDAQNAFNHPSFGVPAQSLGRTANDTGGTGTPYTSTNPINSVTVHGRNIQLGARFSF